MGKWADVKEYYHIKNEIIRKMNMCVAKKDALTQEKKNYFSAVD